MRSYTLCTNTIHQAACRRFYELFTRCVSYDCLTFSMMAYMYVVGSTTGCRLVTRFPVNSAPRQLRPKDNSSTRPQVNSAPLPTRPQGQLVPSQLGPKFKCKALIIVYSNFNATKQDIELETGETGDWIGGNTTTKVGPPTTLLPLPSPGLSLD